MSDEEFWDLDSSPEPILGGGGGEFFVESFFVLSFLLSGVIAAPGG